MRPHVAHYARRNRQLTLLLLNTALMVRRMSYDLSIVTSLVPQMDALRAFLSKRQPNAAIEGNLRPRTGHAVVSVLKRSLPLPIFMIDGPFGIEVEDIPDDVATVVLAPQWLLEVNVPAASSSSDLRLAKAWRHSWRKSFRVRPTIRA